MELAVDLSSLFGSSLVKLDAMRIKQFHDAKLYAAIDDFCILASHSSQSHRTLTTCDKLMRSDHTLYLLWEPSTESGMSRILGILKVGRKQLFLYDKEMKAYRGDLLALLDFYVHFSCQRRGYGKVLFDFMLRNENAEPYEIALDNPSATLIGFLSKHYNLTDAIWQNTSFVVFNCLLESAKNKDTNVPEGWTRSSAPIEIITSKCKSGETSGIESKNEVHGDSERLIDGTMANRSSQARQRKAYILSSKPLW